MPLMRKPLTGTGGYVSGTLITPTVPPASVMTCQTGLPARKWLLAGAISYVPGRR
jgi:hypothetical protein